MNYTLKCSADKTGLVSTRVKYIFWQSLIFGVHSRNFDRARNFDWVVKMTLPFICQAFAHPYSISFVVSLLKSEKYVPDINDKAQLNLLHASNAITPCEHIDYICKHYNDVIMTTMASQITSLTVVYSTLYSGADQRKHQSSASLASACGEFTGSGEFPAQRASNAENVSIWWRLHEWLHHYEMYDLSRNCWLFVQYSNHILICQVRHKMWLLGVGIQWSLLLTWVNLIKCQHG